MQLHSSLGLFALKYCFRNLKLKIYSQIAAKISQSGRERRAVAVDTGGQVVEILMKGSIK